MSGVSGYERRCLVDECPYSVCCQCPVATALDAAGITGKAESRQQVLDAMAEMARREDHNEKRGRYA